MFVARAMRNGGHSESLLWRLGYRLDRVEVFVAVRRLDEEGRSCTLVSGRQGLASGWRCEKSHIHRIVVVFTSGVFLAV